MPVCAIAVLCCLCLIAGCEQAGKAAAKEAQEAMEKQTSEQFAHSVARNPAVQNVDEELARSRPEMPESDRHRLAEKFAERVRDAPLDRLRDSIVECAKEPSDEQEFKNCVDRKMDLQ